MNESIGPAVSLRNVTKRYGKLQALDGIDLDIPRGQTIASLGPNGAGKTTAISLMLGLRGPTSGSVHVFGADPRDVRTRTVMGAMLQSSGVPEYLRVNEVIDLFRTYYPKPMAGADAIGLCGLAGKRTAKIATLSGGQLQRLYFALAICGDPEIVLLDEPTVGLDVEARRAMLATIKGIATRGRTVILTTHYLEEADALADRIVVVNSGRIVADGTAAAIKATISKKRVAYVTGGKRHEMLTDAPEAVLRSLFEQSVPFGDLTVTGASLEEAFLHLTSGQVHHAV